MSASGSMGGGVPPPPPRQPLQRTVRVLLECILVVSVPKSVNFDAEIALRVKKIASSSVLEFLFFLVLFI